MRSPASGGAWWLPDHLDADIAGPGGDFSQPRRARVHYLRMRQQRWWALLAIAIGCGDDTADAPATTDATPLDDAPAGACPTAEIMFTQATGCANDGSVEFCIPDGNAALIAQLEAYEMAISCESGGGGRAGCLARPNLLLCFYPTSFPQQCEAIHGAMTDDTWQDMRAIAALPEVTCIVPTILE
jgi:hypothetical protein